MSDTTLGDLLEWQAIAEEYDRENDRSDNESDGGEEGSGS